MLKKLLAGILCMCIACALLPISGLALRTHYITVNGKVFSNELRTITCGDGTATIDLTTTPCTLTLTNATITESYDMSCFKSDTPLIIKLVGENIINDSSNYGIYLAADDGGFVIEQASSTQPASLTINSTGSAISLWRDNTFLAINSGTVIANGTSYSIYDNTASNSVTVRNGKLICGLTDESGSASSCVAKNINVPKNAVVNVGSAEKDAEKWDQETPMSNYKYLSIEASLDEVAANTDAVTAKHEIIGNQTKITAVAKPGYDIKEAVYYDDNENLLKRATIDPLDSSVYYVNNPDIRDVGIITAGIGETSSPSIIIKSDDDEIVSAKLINNKIIATQNSNFNTDNGIFSFDNVTTDIDDSTFNVSSRTTGYVDNSSGTLMVSGTIDTSPYKNPTDNTFHFGLQDICEIGVSLSPIDEASKAAARTKLNIDEPPSETKSQFLLDMKSEDATAKATFDVGALDLASLNTDLSPDTNFTVSLASDKASIKIDDNAIEELLTDSVVNGKQEITLDVKDYSAEAKDEVENLAQYAKVDNALYVSVKDENGNSYALSPTSNANFTIGVNMINDKNMPQQAMVAKGCDTDFDGLSEKLITAKPYSPISEVSMPSGFTFSNGEWTYTPAPNDHIANFNDGKWLLIGNSTYVLTNDYKLDVGISHSGKFLSSTYPDKNYGKLIGWVVRTVPQLLISDVKDFSLPPYIELDGKKYGFVSTVDELYAIKELSDTSTLTFTISDKSCSPVGIMREYWTAYADTSWYNNTNSEFTLSGAKELAGMALLAQNGESFVGKSIKLSDDIDLSAHLWSPIGTSTTPFGGSFDGCGHIITGMVCDESTQTTDGDCIGLFAYVSDAVIKNLAVTDFDIKAHSTVGAIAGTVDTGTIENCYVKGKIYAADTAGGIAGEVSANSSISNCYSAILPDSTDGNYTHFGGIVGSSLGILTACYSQEIAPVGDYARIGYAANYTCCGTFSATTKQILLHPNIENYNQLPSMSPTYAYGASNMTDYLNNWVTLQSEPKKYNKWANDTEGYPDFTFKIDASCGENGDISDAGTTYMRRGESKTYTITPNGGYAANVSVDGISIGNVTSYQFSDIKANHLIDVTFDLLPIRIVSGGGGGVSPMSYYNITFSTDGGNSVSSQRVLKNSALKEPAAPTKDGYTFGGWYTDSDLTQLYDFASKVTGAVTLYAKWVKDADEISNQIILKIGEKATIVFGKTVTNDVAPLIVNERTMLPSRFIAESLGATVDWDEASQQVTITKGDVSIIISIDSDKASVSGNTVTLDSAAFTQNDRTYTPLRFIAEALGATVTWDEASQQVTITVK